MKIYTSLHMIMAVRMLVVLGLVLFASLAFTAAPAHAQTTTTQNVLCSFTRDLYTGVTGNDVRCLQQYLNIPASATFDNSTHAAVVSWQGRNGLPATGFFGPMSRAKYQSVKGVTTASLNANVYTNANAGIALMQIRNAYAAIQDAEDAIDDSTRNTSEAEDTYTDALESFLTSLIAYMSRDYTAAINAAQRSMSLAEDAEDEAGGGSDDDDYSRGEVKDRLDDVEDMLDDARNDVEDADDDGDDIGDAEAWLDDAEDALNDAEDAYDDEEYADAMDYLDEAEDYIDEALNEIDRDNDDVEDMLDDAWDTLSDARDDVEDADDDGEDIGDADELLDDAEDLLFDAEDALDDDDEDEAEDLIEEALDLIDEALDEF